MRKRKDIKTVVNEKDCFEYTVKEKWFTIVQWIAICAVLAFFFYRSVWAFLILLCFMPFFLKQKKKVWMIKKKWELNLQFKEAILFVSSNLQAGNSIENAFKRAYIDLVSLYGEDEKICKEMFIIAKGLETNCVLETLLTNFGEHSGVEEIIDFAEIFEVGKRSGGSLREIITDCADSISEKIECKRQLEIVISEKQFEQRIMCIIPFLILAYIGITSKGFFDALYHNPFGVLVMTGCLIAYVGAFVWAKTITNIMN